MTAQADIKSENTSQLDVKTQDKNISDNTQQKITQEQTEETAPKNSKDWDKFREARAQDRKRAQEESQRREKAEQETAALKAALESVLSKPNNYSHQQEESEESEEQKIDKKVAEALARERRKYEEERKLREQQEYPIRLAQTFPDFDNVCTTDNIDYLEYHYPEVAGAFKYTPEGFEKWANIYKAVKRFVPNPDSKKDQARAERNLNKPQSISSPGMTSSKDQTPASKLTEQKKNENWQRMQRSLKGLS